MATTAIRITKDGNISRLKFMTVWNGQFLDVDVYHCDEKFLPTGTPLQGVDPREEKEYHMELRKESKARGQFVPEESTNNEWNEEIDESGSNG